MVSLQLLPFLNNSGITNRRGVSLPFPISNYIWEKLWIYNNIQWNWTFGSTFTEFLCWALSLGCYCVWIRWNITRLGEWLFMFTNKNDKLINWMWSMVLNLLKISNKDIKTVSLHVGLKFLLLTRNVSTFIHKFKQKLMY